MKSQVTHLSLSLDQRRLLAMRASQLDVSLSEYIGRLVDADARESGLSQFLTASGKPEVRSAKR